MCRQEIYFFFETNFNFRIIAKLNKKERIFIARVINGDAYGTSNLFVIVPSYKLRIRVSDYMLTFGDFISVKVEAEEKDPMFKNYTHNI